MTAIVHVAADERLLAAYARYDAEWSRRGDGLIEARIELCEALLACGEALPREALAQLDRDRAIVAKSVAVTV